MNGGDKADEEGDDRAHLEDIVNGGQRPVILGSEEQMDEEDADEGEDGAGDEELYGERAGKVGAVLEDGVVGIAPEKRGD